MQEPLEEYLAQVETQLSSLPAAKREAELREIRLHLQMMVEDYIAIGDSPEEAQAAAIRQFGSARKMGKELQSAQNPNRLQRWRPLLAGIAAIVTYSIFFALLQWILADMFGYSYDTNKWPIDLRVISSCFVGGWIAEVIAPRKSYWPVIIPSLFLFCVNLRIALASPNFLSSIVSLLVFGIIYPTLPAYIGIWMRQKYVQKRAGRTLISSN